MGVSGEYPPPNQGCTVPPEGWWCSREPGHDGPCAARPTPEPSYLFAVIDETSLHEAIIKTWGEHGAHNDVFTHMRRHIRTLEQANENVVGQFQVLEAENERLREHQVILDALHIEDTNEIERLQAALDGLADGEGAKQSYLRKAADIGSNLQEDNK